MVGYNSEFMLTPVLILDAIVPLTLSRTTNFIHSSKLKEFADDNFEYDEYGKKFSKRLAILLEKEKLLVTSFFFFSHSVSKDMYCRHIKTRVCFVKD